MKNLKTFLQDLDEAGRCWDGYKPVKGKKPYSPGSCVKEEVELDEGEAWTRKEGQSESGGLNKPSKLDPDSKAAKRRKSFCARMGGMKKRLTSAETARDPDSRINKALRKWNC
jgi:Domain of unknown function (DUF6321)